ncbi:hypothetical protein K435DRAFT_420086 [Dendrothele bispora CBS 962.96]|uniref:Uncharacterized protein n=1 Tax=Dendrothele bispora (strain CBS 962.96) TaxID=1314807 RepID=A0A4V4HCN2_DENBC|nr:hypothetical protein K435DRAFT_420086 [Dendrothele bispora CBS 962.96]
MILTVMSDGSLLGRSRAFLLAFSPFPFLLLSYNSSRVIRVPKRTSQRMKKDWAKWDLIPICCESV